MWTGYVFHEVLKENYNVFFNLNDRDLLDKWIKNSTYLYGSNSCRIPVEPWPIWPSPPSVGFLWRSWPRWRSCWQLSSWWDPSYLARRVIHSNVRGVADAMCKLANKDSVKGCLYNGDLTSATPRSQPMRAESRRSSTNESGSHCSWEADVFPPGFSAI